MSGYLRLDPRPTDYGSVIDAKSDDDGSAIVDAAVECTSWRVISPVPAASPPMLSFVDGVQQHDRRFSAEGGGGWPIGGILASYAAGAMCPGQQEPLRHVLVGRAAILGRGARPPEIAVRATNGGFRYMPQSAANDGPEALESKLNHLRSEMEWHVVRALMQERAGLIVVDGRLPPGTDGAAIGLIKTPQRFPLGGDEQIKVLRELSAGDRSPVFVRSRSDRKYYSWFVGLCTPGPRDIAFSNIAMIEMDDSVSRDDAFHTANLTATLLPRFASRPHRDPRAPQNLLPVGQLERALRRRLGDRAFVGRMVQEAFAREDFAWTF